jgi:hypothetical protein
MRSTFGQSGTDNTTMFTTVKVPAMRVRDGGCRSMLLCLSRGFRRCWQTSDGPLEFEGELLLGRAVSGRDGLRAADGSIERQPVGVGQILGQAAHRELVRVRGNRR